MTLETATSHLQNAAEQLKFIRETFDPRVLVQNVAYLQLEKHINYINEEAKRRSLGSGWNTKHFGRAVE